MRVKILGKFWTLVFKPLRKDDGYCDAPTQAGKQIQIDSRLRGQRKLEICLHEMLHAADWHKDEDAWIAPVAADLARALWRLGYRQTDELNSESSE